VNRFNLTFSGEILAGQDPARVKLRFGKMFAIDDPTRLERFFSGETIILRRNLERKDAAQYYHELHLLGVAAALVKVTTREAAAAIASSPVSAKKTAIATTTQSNGTSAQSKSSQALPKISEQTWAVRSAVPAGKSKNRNTRATKKLVVQKGQTVAQPERTDLAAKIKASKQESLRLATQKKTMEAAALAEQKRQSAAAEARRQEMAAVRVRQAEEEEARRQAEIKRQDEEAAAKQEALATEARRVAGEEAARKEAERARLQQQAAEEAARKKAQKVAAKRKAAEEAALRKARREQQKAERARLRAEENARRKEAQRRAELEEQKRREAEQEARRKAALEEARRREAEAEETRRKAELAELRRREAEEDARLQAELEAIKRREAAEAARLQGELEEKARQARAEAARIKAEAQRQQAEAQNKSAERRRAAAQELAAHREVKRRDQSAGTPPVQTQQTAGKRARSRLTTHLEVPLRKTAQTTRADAPGQRKRQPGEPNLYRLRPFRNTDEVRSRTLRAQQRMRQGYTLGTVALVAALIVGATSLMRAAPPVVTGARAVAVDPHSGPVLLAADSLLFHDRAGVSTNEVQLQKLGVNALEPPLAFDGSGALFAFGRLADDNSTEPSGNGTLQLLRCDLPNSKCQQVSSQLKDQRADAFVINSLNGVVLLADSSAGLLLKIDREGQLLAQASVTLPAHPVLQLHTGLLLVNGSEGPAISVFRYEDSSFGKQLDEILLLPPAAQQAEQTRVGDFLYSGGAWWVLLQNPKSGSTGLYRFDDEWNFLDEVSLQDGAGPLQLANWGKKTLINDPRRSTIQRFNAQGKAEVPFVSTQLDAVIDSHQQGARRAGLVWRGGLLLCAVAAVLGLGFGYLQGLRRLVYSSRRGQGAEPVDDHAQALHWIDPLPNRAALLRLRGISYGLLALGIVLLAVAQSVSVWQLASLLLVLSGPAVALILLSRQAVGHIGILGDQLLLVDHSGMYHMAGGSRVQYRGPFLSIDDVVVFCGSRLLPAFSLAQVQKEVRPIALGGVRVDRNTLMVRLLQCRHPLALGALAILTAAGAAILLLCLQSLF
jgi:hypothetical protein